MCWQKRFRAYRSSGSGDRAGDTSNRTCLRGSDMTQDTGAVFTMWMGARKEIVVHSKDNYLDM